MEKLCEQVEAVLLTGGASRRMGEDKAKLVVDGEPVAQRIARLLGAEGLRVTVLGREPLDGFGFIRDEKEFAGPLAAIGAFKPDRDLVFLCSCDVPGFSIALLSQLRAEIGPKAAAIPVVDGRTQPLCGLYRREALELAGRLASEGETRMMRWISQIDHRHVEPHDRRWAANANTPEEWQELVFQPSTSDSAT